MTAHDAIEQIREILYPGGDEDHEWSPCDDMEAISTIIQFAEPSEAYPQRKHCPHRCLWDAKRKCRAYWHDTPGGGREFTECQHCRPPKPRKTAGVYVLTEHEPNCDEYPVIVLGLYTTKRAARQAERVQRAVTKRERPHMLRRGEDHEISWEIDYMEVQS